jgi:hypothetical protein
VLSIKKHHFLFYPLCYEKLPISSKMDTGIGEMPSKQGGKNMESTTIQINRAPVMTLWAAVVAERMGFDSNEALTLAKAVTGMNAQAKGQRLGIYEPAQETREEIRKRKPDEGFSINILGRPVLALNTDEGIRAADKNKAIDPASVQRYLENKFGDSLSEVRHAMEELADSFLPEDLAQQAYSLYEKFRPEIPEGKKGWGAKGALDLDLIRSLKRQD